MCAGFELCLLVLGYCTPLETFCGKCRREAGAVPHMFWALVGGYQRKSRFWKRRKNSALCLGSQKTQSGDVSLFPFRELGTSSAQHLAMHRHGSDILCCPPLLINVFQDDVIQSRYTSFQFIDTGATLQRWKIAQAALVRLPASFLSLPHAS